jgi:hypothetical protein
MAPVSRVSLNNNNYDDDDNDNNDDSDDDSDDDDDDDVNDGDGVTILACGPFDRHALPFDMLAV